MTASEIRRLRHPVRAIDADWSPAPPLLPLRLRLWGFCLSRCESLHRELRAAARTPAGSALLWANAVLWTMALVANVLL